MLKLGKVPVVAKREAYGHIVNGLTHVLFREAAKLVDEDIASVEDIDKAFTAGPGLRWAIMGPFLTYHLAGGARGIEGFFEKFETGISRSAIKKIIEGVEKEEIVQKKSIKELIKWRDEKLIELLKILYPDTIRY